MERFFKKTKELIFQEQKDILTSALILSAMMLTSRFFGVIRNRTLATYFTKEELDIFFAAFRIPDFVFELIITGALSSAFIPIFIKYKKNPETLRENISSIINVMMLFLFVFIVITVVFADKIIPLTIPGFSKENTDLVVELSRIFILSQLPFMVLGNIFSGIGQANKTFVLTAIAPIVYTLGLIGGTVFLSSSLWIYGPAIGVVIGAFLFFIIQFPIVYFVDFSYKVFALKRSVIKEFLNLIVPRTLSVFSTQIDNTVDLFLATLIGGGSYTIIYFAQRLQLFPVAFVGMSFGQASLPYISSLYKDKDFSAIQEIFISSVLQILYCSVPLSIFFIFARTPLVRIAYGGGRFDWNATVLTAIALSAFALSIPLHSVFFFVTRVFYAFHDTKTPFIINIFAVGINTLLSTLFIVVWKMPVWSLGLSFSIAITINVFILFAAYARRVKGLRITKLLKNTAKIYMISFLSALPAYAVIKIMDNLIFDTARTINVFLLLITSSTMFFVVYFLHVV
jgi:putative peptidoglycan lipid II flippase